MTAEHDTQRAPAPTTRRLATPNRGGKARLLGVDAARGLALLGMMAVHSLWAYNEAGGVTVSYAVAAGRSAATFAVLAGVGIAFMTGRRRVRARDGRGVAAMLAARALVIGAIGFALGWGDASLASVILVYYALMFVLAIPLVFLPTSAVLVASALFVIGVPVGSHYLRAGLPVAVGDNPSLGMLLQDPAGLALELSLTGMYPAVAWLGYICVGLAIGRLDLSSKQVSVRLLVAGLTAAVGASVASWVALGPLGGERQLYAAAPQDGLSRTDVSDILIWGGEGVTPTSTWWWLATDAPHTTTPLALLHTMGSAVAVLGAMLLVARVASTQLTPLAAAGSMVLTLYTAHVIFLNSPLDVFEATPGYLIQVVAAVLFAAVWRHTKGTGPLETLVTRAGKWARTAAQPRHQAATENPPQGEYRHAPRDSSAQSGPAQS